MNTRIFEAFSRREEKVKEYMAGCCARYGMRCTCGPGCRCKNCPCQNQSYDTLSRQALCCQGNVGSDMSSIGLSSLGNETDGIGRSSFNNQHLNVDQQMDFSQFTMGPPAPIDRQSIDPISMIQNHSRRPAPTPHNYSNPLAFHGSQIAERGAPNISNLSSTNNVNRSSIRNSFRNSIRGMSITSETTFGRAMSGLSALSIDWENLEDFDVEVDHSAHVNNIPSSNGNQGPRRSSLRRSVASTGSSEPHITFKV
jgi:hypothetical protein